MTISRNELGRYGEAMASKCYEEAGWEILDTNWRCKFGELDIVAASQDGGLAFCEVKTRSSLAFGTPAEAITWEKQKRIRKLAGIWLSQQKHFYSAEIRFDVAEVIGEEVKISTYS